jgi:hypothetical protein
MQHQHILTDSTENPHSLLRRRNRRDIEVRVRRIAEEEALTLHRRQHMSPAEIIFYYTGTRLAADASFEDAIDTIVRFNMEMIDTRGFAAV